MPLQVLGVPLVPPKHEIENKPGAQSNAPGSNSAVHVLEGTEACVRGAEAWSCAEVHGHGVGPVPELVRWVPARAIDAEEPKMGRKSKWDKANRQEQK